MTKCCQHYETFLKASILTKITLRIAAVWIVWRRPSLSGEQNTFDQSSRIKQTILHHIIRKMSTLITISKDLAPTRPVQGIAPWRSCAALLIDMKGSSIKKMVTTVKMIRVKTIGNVGRYTTIFHLYFGHLPTAESVSPKTQLPHQGCCIFGIYLASPLFYALPLMLKLNWEGLLACQQFWNSQNFPIVTQASLVCFASIFVNLSVFTFLPLSVFASTVLRLATQFLQSTSLACLTLFLG